MTTTPLQILHWPSTGFSITGYMEPSTESVTGFVFTPLEDPRTKPFDKNGNWYPIMPDLDHFTLYDGIWVADTPGTRRSARSGRGLHDRSFN
jgi:hypothetical protein